MRCEPSIRSGRWNGAQASRTSCLLQKSFRGQQAELSFGAAYAFTETGGYGEVYRYKFSTGEIKTPLQDAVTAAGWTWRGVAFGRL